LLSTYGFIDTAQAYPYTGKCGNVCHFTRSGVGATLDAYAVNNIVSEVLLQQLLQHGPVTAEVNANTQTFQLYAGGILEDPECTATQVNHSLLVVGYGSENGKDFWIARNRYSYDI
jgi:cathepsin L